MVYPQDWNRGETDCPVRDAIQRVLRKGYRAVVEWHRIYIKSGSLHIIELAMPDEVSKVVTDYDLSHGMDHPLKEVRFTLSLPTEVLV